MNKHRRNFILGGIILVTILGAYITIPYVYSNRVKLLQSPYVQKIIPIYHSFRKIPDFFFIPFTMLSDSKLEKYELTISEKQTLKLNQALIKEPFNSDSMKSGNKVWANASFRAPGYTDNVKVKYRGQLANQWNSYKKSYTIKFPKDHLFKGTRELTLIIPIDRGYFSTSLNNYRARKMGLLVPKEFYARLSVNGSEPGVMLAMEHWSQTWLEKQPVSALSEIYGINDPPPVGSVYDMKNIGYWKSWNVKSDTFPTLETLMQFVSNSTDKEFEALAPAILDLKAFYAVDTVRLLTGGYHASDDGNNIVLIFDATEGRFKPIPFNAGLSEESRSFVSISAPLLQKRIWNIPKFRAERDLYIKEYIKNNTEDDLKFVDNWIAEYKPEFYKDNAKLENNFMFRNKMKLFRDTVAKHTLISPNVLTGTTTEKNISSVSLLPTEKFKYLLQTALTPQEFVKIHPQFSLLDNTIKLSGFVNLRGTIILPRNTELIVDPGTTIVMGADTSLISYSAIRFSGTKTKPIKVKAQDTNKPWGIIAAINTQSTSSIQYATFSDGGYAKKIDGVLFTGMLSFRNADVIIKDSNIINARGEDGINIKAALTTIENTNINDTFSDGLDVDFINPNSIIKNNTFANIGGDAIDISWTDALIVGNQITSCYDKGVSVGERSNPTIIQNSITKCDMGIAIKDQSHAVISNNTIENNRIAITAYQKKDFFGGGVATLKSNNLRNNTEDIFHDSVSTILSE